MLRRQYIYAIIDTKRPRSFGTSSLGGGAQPVRALASHGLAAVVSPCDLADFTALPRDELLRCLAEHQRVVERIMIEDSVVPVKFGTTVDSATEVERLLAASHQLLSDLLAKLRGMIEMEVVATWTPKRLAQVFQEIATEPLIAERSRTVLERGSLATKEERAAVGQMVQECLLQRKAVLRDEMIGFLRPACVDAAVNGLLSDEMILNVSCLLARSAHEDLQRLVADLDRQTAACVDFRCIGPLPPYSFATVEVMLSRADEIAQARHLLGLGESISEKQLVAAYRQRAAQCHPDVNPGDAAGLQFRRLLWAYSLLRAYCQNLGGRDNDCVHSLLPRDVSQAILSIRRQGNHLEGEAWYQKVS